MPNFFVIMINFKAIGAPPTEKIENVLNTLTVDWLRFAGNQYIVNYGGSTSILSTSIRAILDPKADILILPVSLDNRAGWASNLVVDWLTKYAP